MNDIEEARKWAEKYQDMAEEKLEEYQMTGRRSTLNTSRKYRDHSEAFSALVEKLERRQAYENAYGVRGVV